MAAATTTDAQDRETTVPQCYDDVDWEFTYVNCFLVLINKCAVMKTYTPYAYKRMEWEINGSTP